MARTMTAQSLATADQQQPSTPAIRKNGRPPRVTGQLAVALKAIAWDGAELHEAAQAAGMKTRNLRLALEKRHVLAFLKEQREVFRSYVSAQNIRHAKELRDTSKNAMARLGAMKYIDNVADEATISAARARAPGVVIVIGDPAAAHTAHMRQIEPKPLIEHTSDSHADESEPR